MARLCTCSHGQKHAALGVHLFDEDGECHAYYYLLIFIEMKEQIERRY